MLIVAPVGFEADVLDELPLLADEVLEADVELEEVLFFVILNKDEKGLNNAENVNILIVLLVSTLAAYTGEGEKDANEMRETNKTTNNFI